MATATMTKTTNWREVELKIKKVAREFLMEAYGFELEIPVRVNGRLTSTCGRFIHGRGRNNPVAIEIGKNYIKHQPWHLVVETIKHECIHFALYVLGKPYTDGHPYFESELRKHGSHSTKTVQYKGKCQVYQCPSCKTKFQRRRKLPNNGAGYRCSGCKEQIAYIGEGVV